MSTLAARVLAAGAAALTLTLVGAGPALAATPTPAPTLGASPQQATPTERAAAEVRPAIVYVTEKFSAYVADETGTYFNNGNPYELTATCTGFGVNPDGYVATAGHCLDTYSPDGINIQATVTSAKANLDLVRGIKGHAEIGGFARWGIKVLQMSAEIGRKTNLPLYVHFGQLWGLPKSGANGEDADTILERVIPELRPGDILAHPFTRHPGGFVNREGEVHEVIQAALDRGLKVDVGHGSHFSYRLARKALDAGIVPNTLGADMHGYNTHVPAPPGTPAEHDDDEANPFAGQAKFSLTQAMSSMLALGLTLEQVVPMVTTNAAAMIGLLGEIGTLRPGSTADVSVLADERGRFILSDNEKNQVVAERLLQPVFCLRAGQHYDANATILPEAVAA